MKLRKMLSLLMAACIGLAGLPVTQEMAEKCAIVAHAETSADDFSFFESGWRAGEIYGYSGTATDVVIPSKIDGVTVTKIGQYAFKNNETITSVKIPNTVTEIQPGAFSGCTSLEKVILPYSLINLGAYAFWGCSSLVSIEIPDSVNTIGYDEFAGCSSLESVSLPSKLTGISSGTFRNCVNLKEITIPDSATYIADAAFTGCHKLTNVTIGSGVKSIGFHTFGGCIRLTSIKIPENVEKIENEAFPDCYLLKDVTILNPDCEIDSSTETISNAYEKRQNRYQFLGKIYGYENSTAQAYAEQCGYTFVPIGGEDHSVKLAYLSGEDVDFRYGTFEEDLNTLLDHTPSAFSFYNPKLSYMLSILAQSAYDPVWAEFNYNNLGFMDKTFYDYDSTYTQEDNCGYVLGYQDLPDGTREYLIDVRGTVGNWGNKDGTFITEWLSDLNAGYGFLDPIPYYPKDHYGFSQAAARLIASLREYCGGEIPTENVRFILTGHSRGAAVANLVARHLINSGVQGSDLYAYTFACPDVSIDYESAFQSFQYQSIYNINCAQDFVGQTPSNLLPTLSIQPKSITCHMGGFWDSVSGINQAGWGKYGNTLFWDTAWEYSKYPTLGGASTYHPCDTSYIPFLATDDGTNFKSYYEMHEIQRRNKNLIVKSIYLDDCEWNDSFSITISDGVNTALSVVNGTVDTIDDNIAANYVDGRLYLDLPADTAYTIEVSSPEGNTATVGIADYTAEYGATSASVYEVPESAVSYTITIPAETPASVTTADGTDVPPVRTWLLGDVNEDGSVSVKDVVLLQKWLLAVPDTKLPDWKAADCYADDQLDAFDLSMMKRILLQK